MHKKLLVSACALGFMVPALATDWFDAGVKDYADWPADGTDKVIADAGTWSNTAMAGLAGSEGAKYLAITNAESALTFTAEAAKALSDQEVTFTSEVQYTAFEEEDLPTIPDGAKAGLTVVQTSEGVSWRAIRYNATTESNEWVELECAVSAATATSQPVTVSVKMGWSKLSYKVNGADLTDEGTAGFDIPSEWENLSVASYQGIGEVKSLAGSYEGAPWSGAGTEESPYIVADAAGLQAMATQFAAGKYADKYFRMDSDIDMSDVASSWSGIGTQDHPFTGTFNGYGLTQTITGLNGAALFAYTDGATIKLLAVEDGPFVGYAAGTSLKIEGCWAKLSQGFTPTYAYAFVLDGEAEVTFDYSGEEGCFGPSTLAPIPNTMTLTDTLFLAYDDGDELTYLINLDWEEQGRYLSSEDNYVLLHDYENQATVVTLMNSGEVFNVHTNFGAFTTLPAADVGDGLYLWTTVNGKLLTYEAKNVPQPTENVTVTFENIGNVATIAVAQGDVTNDVNMTELTADVAKGTSFTVIYTAEEGYLFADGSATKEVAKEGVSAATTIDVSTDAPATVAEAKIEVLAESTTYYYATLKEALDSEVGDTVTLNTDVTLTENLTIAQGKTVETDGKTLTINAGVTNTLCGQFYFNQFTELVNNGAFVIDGDDPQVFRCGNAIIGYDETAEFIKYSKGAVMTFAGGNCTVTGTIEAFGTGSHGHMFLLGDTDAKITAEQENVPANKVGLVDSLTANYEVAYAEGAYYAKEKAISVTGVSLDVTATNLTVGSSFTLTATVAPENATVKTVTWSSDADAVATVTSEGVVEAVAAGTATITVTTTDGEFKATCEVTVTAAPEPKKPDPSKPAEYDNESDANAAADAINEATPAAKAELIGDPFTGISAADKQTYAGYVDAQVTAGEGEKSGKYLVSLVLNEAGETQLKADTKAGVEAIDLAELADLDEGELTTAHFKGTVGMWYNLFSGAAVDDVTTGSEAVQCTSATEDMSFDFTKPSGAKGFFQTKAGLTEADVTTK